MKLQHPKNNTVIQVDPDHAQPYFSQGWVENTPQENKKNKPDTGDNKKTSLTQANTMKENDNA
jgi:hypothetical protein